MPADCKDLSKKCRIQAAKGVCGLFDSTLAAALVPFTARRALVAGPSSAGLFAAGTVHAGDIEKISRAFKDRRA